LHKEDREYSALPCQLSGGGHGNAMSSTHTESFLVAHHGIGFLFSSFFTGWRGGVLPDVGYDA